MNVAFLIARFPPHDIGGAERQADRLAAQLALRGHRVTVITRRWEGRAPREERDGYTVVRVPVALAGPPRAALDLVQTLGALRSLRPRPDVVLCFQTFASGWIGGWAEVLLGLPAVVWVRGENEYRFDRSPHRFRPSAFAWRRARRVLVQSEEHRGRLLAALGARNALAADGLAPRLDVLGNGVDVPAKALRPGDDWLYVGRRFGHQGVDVLLEALARVHGTAAAAPLWVVGDGPARKRLEAKAKALGVDARFEGFQGRDRLASYYERARAIVLPSTQGEGLPNALLEAMAYGLPTVATALPGVSDLARGAGPIVAPGDPAALAEAHQALTDPAERRRAGFVARERALERSWDAVASRLEVVLEQAAAPAPRVWIVAPHPTSRGGVASVVRQMVRSSLARRYRLAVLPTYRAGSVWTRLRLALTGTTAIATRLVVKPPHLVHLKVASRGSFARKAFVGALCRLRGVPVIVHVHGGGFDRFIEDSPAHVRSLARGLLEGSPVVLSLSESWAARLRRLFPAARIEVLPNPIEVGRFEDLARERFRLFQEGERPPGPPVGVFLGDVIERKGVFDLVAAWSEVARHVPGARLVLAGDGERAAVRAAARASGVAPLVETPGWVDFEEKRRLLARATVFILPSFFEGVPISLLEAMAAGLPSVVTPVGGVPEAVSDGQAAIVVPAGDRAALASAIVQIFRSPELARALGGSGRIRAQEFDLPVFADRVDAVYRRILLPGGGSREAARAQAREATRWA